MQQYAEPVTDPMGNVQPGALVTILNLDGSLATLFNADGFTPLANPVTTDVNGVYTFKAANGSYRRSVTIAAKAFDIPGEIIVGSPSDQASLAQLAAPTGATLISRLSPGVGAVKRSLDDMYIDTIDVMDFMSIAQRADMRAGTTLLDCAAAIQAAVDYAAVVVNNTREVRLYGRAKINSTIAMRDNVKLVGVSRDIGYWYAFDHSSELIAGAAMLCMIDVTASNDCIDGIALYGNNVAQHGVYTHVPVGQPRKSSGTYLNVPVTLTTKSGWHLYNKGLLKMRNIQSSGAIECGIDLSNTGDIDIDGFYVNSNNPDSASTVNGPSSATVYGVGLRIRDSSGNINIRGGKYEFNRIGILLNNVDGVNINGAQFDTNRGGDIAIIGDSMIAGGATTENASAVTSVQITGCRFLGGTEGSQGTTASIYVKNARYVTITGGGVKRAGDSARDFATDTAQGHQYGIWLDNAEYCTVSGVNLHGAGVVSCLKINHATPSLAQHTVSGNSLDGTENIQAGTIRDVVSYSNHIFSAGVVPIAKNTSKAFVRFAGDATVSNGAACPIKSSFNVQSVIKNAAGDYTVNFATPMADANYASFASVRNWFGMTDAAVVGVSSAGSLNVFSTTGGAQSANGDISVTVFG